MIEPLPANTRIILTSQHPWGDYIEARIGWTNRDGQRCIITPLTYETLGTANEFMARPTEPTMLIPARSYEGPSVAQQLMDQLWQLGVRPSDIGTPGHLAATTSHLADMRALVAKALEVELP